jgi:hypothetical protein
MWTTKTNAQQNAKTIAITGFQGFDYVTLNEIRFSFNVLKEGKALGT